MFVMDCLKVNQKGNVEIGGCDTVELAKEYGTPLYVMDEGLIRQNCRTYKNAMDKYYNGKGLVLYASKAFSTIYMCKLVADEGLGLDVVSGGELYTALKAGFPAEKIYFHGNNKTVDELTMAIDNNVGRIVCDNVDELKLLSQIAHSKGKTAKILFRIKPGIDAHTHDFIQTGQIDSKFGVALETGEAFEAYKASTTLTGVEAVGVHCHIGSQIFDLEPFKLAAKVMMGFVSELKEKLGLEVEELNLGGGYGIKYLNSHDPVDYDEYIKAVSEVVKDVVAEKGLKLPFILMEPGRSIVGSAGLTLYTVGSVKEIPDVRTYVSVDGGMADNPRHIMYGSEYDAILAQNPNGEKTDVVTIAGKCCESGDVLIRDIALPTVKSGDILAVLATGAYNYSMSSHYNRIPNPAVVMADSGKSKLIVKRESYDDIIKNDIL